MEEKRTKAYQFDTLQQWCVSKSSQSDTNIITKHNRPVMHGRPATCRLWEHSGNMWVKHIQVSFIIRKYHECGEDGTLAAETLVRSWCVQQFTFNCVFCFFLLPLSSFLRQASTHNHAHIIIRFSLKHLSLTHTHKIISCFFSELTT